MTTRLAEIPFSVSTNQMESYLRGEVSLDETHRPWQLQVNRLCFAYLTKDLKNRITYDEFLNKRNNYISKKIEVLSEEMTLRNLNSWEQSPFLSRTKFPLISKITPDWLSPLVHEETTAEKVTKLFVDIAKSFLCLTMIVPAITFVADLISYIYKEISMPEKKVQIAQKITNLKNEIQQIEPELQAINTSLESIIQKSISLSSHKLEKAISWSGKAIKIIFETGFLLGSLLLLAIGTRAICLR
jgi:hypothetical protein